MDGREHPETMKTITIDRESYEKILIELGELRQLSHFLEEHKAALKAKEEELKEVERELQEVKAILLETEWKDFELEHAQMRVRELEIEVEVLKGNLPWWRRFFA